MSYFHVTGKFLKYQIYLILSACCMGCSTSVENSIRKTYYDNGKIKYVQSYRNGDLEGISREYYETGSLKYAINFRENRIHGMYHTYDPNGSLWTEEIYDDGDLVKRRKFNGEGEVIQEEGFDKD